MKVRVIARSIGFGPGSVLALTAAQAASRLHNLEQTARDGVFGVLSRIEFKAGEVVDVLEADLGKAAGDLVAPVDADAKAIPATSRRRAERA